MKTAFSDIFNEVGLQNSEKWKTLNTVCALFVILFACLFKNCYFLIPAKNLTLLSSHKIKYNMINKYGVQLCIKGTKLEWSMLFPWDTSQDHNCSDNLLSEYWTFQSVQSSGNDHTEHTCTKHFIIHRWLSQTFCPLFYIGNSIPGLFKNIDDSFKLEI